MNRYNMKNIPWTATFELNQTSYSDLKIHKSNFFACNKISVIVMFLFVFPQLPFPDYHRPALITSHLSRRRIARCS